MAIIKKISQRIFNILIQSGGAVEVIEQEVFVIEIMNMHHSEMSMPYDFRIDRESPLGNPNYCAKNWDKREACQRYKLDFDTIKENDDARQLLDKMLEAYKRYKHLRLFCWCAPGVCHGETIASYIEDMYIEQLPREITELGDGQRMLIFNDYPNQRYFGTDIESLSKQAQGQLRLKRGVIGGISRR